MKRLVIATVVLLGSALSAYAHHPDDTYHDMIRPNGHARSDAVFYSAVTACKRISHNSIYAADSSAMKRCMLTRGYQWQSTNWVADRPTRSSPSSTVDWTDFLQWQDSPPPPVSDNPACPNSLC